MKVQPRALELAYGAAIGIESFTYGNKTIAVAASIRRPLAPTQDALAGDALDFLRTLLAA